MSLCDGRVTAIKNTSTSQKYSGKWEDWLRKSKLACRTPCRSLGRCRWWPRPSRARRRWLFSVCAAWRWARSEEERREENSRVVYSTDKKRRTDERRKKERKRRGWERIGEMGGGGGERIKGRKSQKENSYARSRFKKMRDKTLVFLRTLSQRWRHTIQMPL